MDYSILVLKQSVIMFLITCIGMICYKTNIITKQAQKFFSGFVLKVVIPCFIFMSFQTELSPELLKGMLYALLLSVLSHILLIVLSMIVIRKDEKTEYAIERFSLVYTNCGFMGIPLISGVFGTEGALYATVYLMVFNILVWTHGVIVIKNNFSSKELLKVFTSPTMISIALGIICLAFGIKVPEVLAKPLDYVAAMNTPLPMTIAGVMIAQNSLLDTIKDFRAIVVSVLKLLIFPIIMFFVLRLVPCSEVVLMSIMLSVSCPTATIGTLFAIEHNKNAAYASRIFAITTVASSITMPLIILFMNMFS
jgi:predicted permease